MVTNMKKNKFAKRRMFVLFLVFVCLIGYMGYITFNYWNQILANKKIKKELEEKYNNLLSEKEILESDVVKLQDPNYAAKYAREKYLYTKDGELIIKIVDD